MRLTVDQILNPAVALAQRLFCLSPASRLRLELGLESGFAILCSLQRRLVAFLLVGQPLGQAVTLLHQGGELGLLSTNGGLRPSQLLP